MKTYLFFFSFLLVTLDTPIQAQCNPEDWVEQGYSALKSLERFTLNYFAPAYSVPKEVAIGDSLHKMIMKDYLFIQNKEKQTYIEQIVAKLAKHVQGRNIPFKVHIIEDNKNLNAFSIAGGHIYMTTYLLDWVESEDELAFILAHEMSHVNHGHAIGKVKKAQLTEEFAQDFLGQEYADYGPIAGKLSLLLSSPFGQIEEYEADQLGVTLVSKAGYDPRKGLRFFEKMAQKEYYSTIEKIFRTHPYSAERHHCLDEYMRIQLKK